MNNELDLTYGEIARELIEAIERREQAAQELMDAQVAAIDPKNLDTAAAHLAALVEFDAAELVVREYLKAEVKKADSIVGYVRRTEALAKARHDEADRLYELAKADEQRVTWLKDITMIAMREMDRRKCEGARGILQLWGNGGKQPVEVRQPELLPEKYQRFTLTINGKERRILEEHGAAYVVDGFEQRAKPIEPDTDGICAALLAGDAVPGAVLKDRGESLRIK